MRDVEITEEMVEAFGRAWSVQDKLERSGQVMGTIGSRRRAGLKAVLDMLPEPASIAPTYRPGYAKVILFRESGKYYTEEEWQIPAGSIGPWDMAKSPDFRRIDNGPVLVESQEPWGYPILFPTER